MIKDTKKIPPEYHRRDVMLVTEVLILYSLSVAPEDNRLLTEYEIRKSVSHIKHEGKKDVQITGPMRNLEKAGAITSKRVRVSEETEHRVTRFTISPKGENILSRAIDLMNLLLQAD
jgi:DNA-binding PadR family transcriptional regulator